jgi:hypothetical protein
LFQKAVLCHGPNHLMHAQIPFIPCGILTPPHTCGSLQLHHNNAHHTLLGVTPAVPEEHVGFRAHKQRYFPPGGTGEPFQQVHSSLGQQPHPKAVCVLFGACMYWLWSWAATHGSSTTLTAIRQQ